MIQVTFREVDIVNIPSGADRFDPWLRSEWQTQDELMGRFLAGKLNNEMFFWSLLIKWWNTWTLFCTLLLANFCYFQQKYSVFDSCLQIYFHEIGATYSGGAKTKGHFCEKWVGSSLGKNYFLLFSKHEKIDLSSQIARIHQQKIRGKIFPCFFEKRFDISYIAFENVFLSFF